MKGVVFTIIAISLWMPESAAQMKLRVRLIDSMSEAIIYQGSVRVLGSEYMEKSNGNGEFTIFSNMLSPGDTLTLMASAYHFESKMAVIRLRDSTIVIPLERYIRQTASEERHVFTASGQVVDENRNGLSNVSILAANIRGEAFTNDKGKFNFHVDEIRPIPQTELWFSRPGYLTKRMLISSLQKHNYKVKLDTAVVLVRSRAKPSKKLVIKFLDLHNQPVSDVELWVNGDFIGKTDLFGCYHLTLGESESDSVKIEYSYKMQTDGFKAKVAGDPLILLNPVGDSIKIHIDPFHQELLVKTFRYPNLPLPHTQVQVGKKTAMTDTSGKLRLKVTKAQGEVVARKDGFVEARENYEITGRTGKIEILLIDSMLAVPPKKFIVSVFEAGGNHQPVPGALVELGNSISLTNDSGVVTFENPKFPARLSVQKDRFEAWRKILAEAQPHYSVWLKPMRTPVILKLTITDSTKRAPIPNPVVFCENNREVVPDHLGNMLIYDASLGERVRVAAEGYCTKEIILPYVSGNLPIHLSRLPKALSNISQRDTPLKPPPSAAVANWRKNHSSFSGFIGLSWWRFERQDTIDAKPNVSSNFVVGGVYLQKNFPLTLDTVQLKGAALRLHLQVQGPSQKLTNLNVGSDFLLLPNPGIAITAGLCGAFYDFQIAGVKSSWATPFFSLGLELDLSDSLFQRIPKIPLVIRYSYNTLFADHFQLGANRKYSLPKNYEAPRVRHDLNFAFKTGFGNWRAGYSRLSPSIGAAGIRLQAISRVVLYCGIEF